MPARSYAHGASSVELLGETLGENLRRIVQSSGGSEALVARAQGLRYTYGQFLAEAVRCARGLVARGVKKGDRVGIWSPNRAEWVVLQYGSALAGAVLVNVNPAYKTSELEYVVKQSEMSVLIHARAFRASDFSGMVNEVSGRCPLLRECIELESGWARLLDDSDKISDKELAEREASLDPDEPINIQYTSGTTGFPKGATLSHRNILNNGFFIGEALRYSAKDRVCIPVPFYHCFGMVLGNLACTTHGACIVVPGEAFDPATSLEAVAAEKCTALYGVPTMFIAMLDHPKFAETDKSTLRTGIMAGSPCPVEVMKKVQSIFHMPEVTICYGMTETSPVSTQSAVDDPLDKRVGTVGRVHPHIEVKVADPATGSALPRGTPGELCTRGYSVMLGYYRNEEATRSAIDASRWMHTGDLAVMDDDGYLNIVGRIKDMIIRGGEKIFPREVEEYLYTHPEVSDVQVIGVPSEKYYEEVMAWVKLKPGATATAESLDAFCRGKIATVKIPRYWKICDGFPITVTGKVQKFKMRELAIEELGLQKAAATRTA